MSLNVGSLVATLQADARPFTRGVDNAGRSLRQFSYDANGRLRDVNGRFVSVAEAARRMGDATAASGRRGSLSMGGLARAMGRVGRAAGNMVPSMGAAGAAVKGVGVAAGISALPSLGALVPMLVGAGAAAGVAHLAFDGVGEAASLASEDAEAYKEALDEMSKPQREFTKELVEAKDGFKAFGKEIQKIVLPSFTEALRDADPAIKAVKGGLKDMAGVFADFGDEFGKLFASDRFASALRKNMSMGAEFFGDMIKPLTRFTQGLLDFGAASKPTLDAFSDGIGGLLGKGIPGFFEGLQGGIKGSAKMFDGLFDAVNKILPAFGELVGAITETVGPALGQIFRSEGNKAAGMMRGLADAVVYLKPLFMEIAGAVRIFNTALGVIGGIGKRVANVLLETLWPSFRDAKNAVGPLQTLADWFDKNEKAVHDFTIMAANGILDFAATAIESIPGIIRNFRYMTTGILTAFDAIVSGAAITFGWLPGIGDKLKKANKDFDVFKDGVITSLHEAEAGAKAFSDSVVPRLERNKLLMNISDWKSKIKAAEKQLVNAKGEKKAKLTANIKDWRNKVDAAEKQLTTMKDEKTAKLRGDIRDWNSKLRAAERKLNGLPPGKTAKLRGEISDLRNKISEAHRRLNGLNGKTALTYIRTVYQSVRGKQSFDLKHGPRTASGGLVGYAGGGSVQSFPSGGLIRGPGTGTSDSIVGMFPSGAQARVSNREFVIQAAAVSKYGTGLFRALNSMSVPAGAAAARPTAMAAVGGGGSTYAPTINVYPQRSNFGIQDLSDLQRRQETYARVGRPN